MTEEEDIPGPKIRGGNTKGPSKSTKTGAVTLSSQESIQDDINSDIPSKEKEVSPAQSQASKSSAPTQANSNTEKVDSRLWWRSCSILF